MQTYVARSRNDKTHYFVRVLDRGTAFSNAINDASAALERLLSANTHELLAAAIDGMPPLLGSSAPAASARIFELEEAARQLDVYFIKTDPVLLATELFMSDGEQVKRSALNGIDAVGCRLAESFRACREDAVVVFELVEDWMTLRNSLKIASMLKKSVGSSVEDGIMSAAGFKYLAETTCGFPLHAIPLKFLANTYLAGWSFSRFGLDQHRPQVDYLFTQLNAGPWGVREGVFTASQIDVVVNPGPSRFVGDEKNAILCIQDGASQKDVALAAVEAMTRAFSDVCAEDGASIAGIMPQLWGAL